MWGRFAACCLSRRRQRSSGTRLAVAVAAAVGSEVAAWHGGSGSGEWLAHQALDEVMAVAVAVAVAAPVAPHRASRPSQHSWWRLELASSGTRR